MTIQSDLIIAGGGNAALCAGISAAERGVSVTILEAAPKAYRGGNSRHTRNFRIAHDAPLGVLEDAYRADEFYDDLIKVTQGKTDPALARSCIDASPAAYDWMARQGVRFQSSLTGTLSLSHSNAFFLGGGKALVNALYRKAAALGVRILYAADVCAINIRNAYVETLTFTHAGTAHTIKPKALIVASGGFQANLEWLREAWGPGAENFLIRGTPYNRGAVLRALLDQGCESVGDPTACHAVAIDGRAPKFDGGIVTRLDCVPFSVVLNQRGERFYDEGEDIWPKRYAIWGRLVAAQPDQTAYAIIDSRSADLFMPSVFPPVQADTIGALMAKLGLPVDQACATIAAFNAACPEDLSNFSPQELDGVATRGLPVAKTNWARPINARPFLAYALRPGVTFTYLGLKVDDGARVQTANGGIENLWAAGEIMAGSILGQGYLAGFGMTIGTVFGRKAGEAAHAYVQSV